MNDAPRWNPFPARPAWKWARCPDEGMTVRCVVMSAAFRSHFSVVSFSETACLEKACRVIDRIMAEGVNHANR